MPLDSRFAIAIGWAALAAWSPAIARAGGVDTTGTGTESTGSSGTTETSEGDESTDDIGPCLSVTPEPPPGVCECNTTGESDGAAALGLLPLLAIRRRKRSELIDRFEGRLPADVLARLRSEDED